MQYIFQEPSLYVDFYLNLVKKFANLLLLTTFKGRIVYVCDTKSPLFRLRSCQICTIFDSTCHNICMVILHLHSQIHETCSDETLLKCGFCKKLLLYECNSHQLPTLFHFVITLGGCKAQANPPKSDDRMKKVGNWLELHS